MFCCVETYICILNSSHLSVYNDRSFLIVIVSSWSVSHSQEVLLADNQLGTIFMWGAGTIFIWGAGFESKMWFSTMVDKVASVDSDHAPTGPDWCAALILNRVLVT